MLLLTMFILICSAAVLFLLRFLFAIESELGSERKRMKASNQTRSGIWVRVRAPDLAMIQPNSWRRAPQA